MAAKKERIPDEIVEQMTSWRARLIADRNVRKLPEFQAWALAVEQYTSTPEFRDHFDELEKAWRPKD